MIGVVNDKPHYTFYDAVRLVQERTKEKTMFIPTDIQCFWCNGRMERGTNFSSFSINHITYFCKNCGAVSHFAMNHKCKIASIEVEYKTTEKVVEE